MIKAKGHTASGRQVLVFGLSFQNLKRLQAGDPIQFDGKPYGVDCEFFIFAGRDEATMAATLRSDNPGIEEHIEDNAP